MRWWRKTVDSEQSIDLTWYLVSKEIPFYCQVNNKKPLITFELKNSVICANNYISWRRYSVLWQVLLILWFLSPLTGRVGLSIICLFTNRLPDKINMQAERYIGLCVQRSGLFYILVNKLLPSSLRSELMRWSSILISQIIMTLAVSETFID